MMAAATVRRILARVRMRRKPIIETRESGQSIKVHFHGIVRADP
jgi:hypothetical protein